MIIKTPKKQRHRWYQKLESKGILTIGHKLFVKTAIALTLFGLTFSGFHVYTFFRYVKPERDLLLRLEQQKLLNQSLLENDKEVLN